MINRRNLSVDDKEVPVTGRNGSAWRRRLPGMAPRTIAILAAGAMTVAGCTSVNSSNTPSNPGPDPRAQILRNGDRAQAGGEVVALPGKPVRFCAPVPSPPRYVRSRSPGTAPPASTSPAST